MKTVDPGVATIGETVGFTLRTAIPANTNFYQAAAVDRLPIGYEFISSVTPTVTCTTVEPTPQPCAISLVDVLGPVDDPDPAPPSSRLTGFYFGDILSNPVARLVTLTYAARVRNITGNSDGGANDPLVNTARNRWDLFDKPETARPTTPLYPWQASGTPDSASVDIIEPRLTIRKTTPDTSIEPGQEFVYTILVSNAGTSTAFNTVVTDTLPSGIDLVPSATSPDQAGVVAGKTITWNIPSTSLDPGEPVTLTYRARLAPSSGISASTPSINFRNNASVTRYTSLADGTDPNGRVYTGPVSRVTVAPRFPVLTTTKTLESPDPAYIGDPVTWQIVTRNNSPSGGARAFETTIRDVLPPNWTFDSTTSIVRNPGNVAVTPTSFSETPDLAGDRLTWTLATLAPGQTYTVRFTATPEPGVAATPLPATFTNRTTSVAKDGSGATGNATAQYFAESSDTADIHRVDLEITKASTGPAVAGESFSWDIVVRNLGPSTAVGPFVVTDAIPTLPAGVTFESASGTGWTCTPATGPATPPTTGDVTCQRNAADTLAAGAQFEAITFTMRIPSDTPDGTLISNTATVGGQRTYEAPTDLANNTATDTDTIITRADLRLVKSVVDPPGLVAGTSSTYNLAITNLGPSTSRATLAQPIVVRDSLPATVSYVSATDIAATPTFTCSHDNAPTGGIVTCTRTTDMLLNATSNIRIVVAVPSGLTGNLTNTGTVTPQITTDPTPGNNTSTITSPIVERADLGITKTALGPNVPGEPTTYRLRVTNNGPGDATVRIQDTLPPGLTFRSSSNVSGNWNCVASTVPDPVPGFRCDLVGKLTFTTPTPNFVEVDVLVDTAASVTGTVINTATVSTTAQDTNPNNNTATAPLTFIGVADVALTKSSSGTAVPGGPITWTINVANLGPSDSQGPVRVEDSLPAGIIGPVTAGGAGWSCSTDVALKVTCMKAAALAAGANSNITLTAVIDPTSGGPNSIVNSATVFPTSLESNNPSDPKTANNTDSDVVTLSQPAVTLTKAVSNATPQPGDVFTYTMTLTNAVGAAPAYNMKVSDVVPTGVVWVSGGALTAGTVNWTVPGPLAGGASTTVSFVARLAASTGIDSSVIANNATLDSFESVATGGRTYPGNSDVADITPVFPKLIAAKVALGANPTYIDDEFAWQITITNTGGGTAAKVDVTDLLPRNWTYVTGSTTITTPSGVTTPNPTTPIPDLNPDPNDVEPKLTWLNVGALSPGQSLTVAFRAVPTPEVADNPGVGSGQPHTNQASAATTDNAGFAGNKTGDYVSNEATADAFIDAADLEIRKLNAATPAIAGQNYSWTLKVRNLGDDPAVGPFTVVDTLPTITPVPLTFVSATGTGWACTQAAGAVTCTRAGSLPAPASTDDPAAAFPDITVTVAIPSDYLSAAGMTNTSTIVGRTYDPDLDNNTATAVTPVSGLADLAIAKRHTTTTVTAGSNIIYQLDVTNNGPSTSRAAITVVDTLPPNTTFVSASNTAAGDAWNCVNGVPSVGKVTCTLTGDILTTAPAESIVITVRLGSNAPPTVPVVNTAQVIPGSTPEGATNPNDPDDPKIKNNTATDSVLPATSADLVMDKSTVGTLVPGSVGVYRLRVDNIGPSDANAPTITDTLPDGLTFAGYTSNPAAVIGAAPGVWTCAVTSADLRTFSCTLDRALVTPGFSVVDVNVNIVSTLVGPIVNTSTVTSTTLDPITGNNTDSDNSTFTTLADLAIAKTGPTTPIVAGATFDWTLTVTNNGPSVSRAPIRVFDALPDSVVLVTDVATIPAPWSCTSAPATLPGFSTNITCTLIGDLAAPAAAPANVAPPITFAVRALPAAGPAVITNRSFVQGATTEPNTPEARANNSSNHDVTLEDLTDLQIVKTPDTQTVTAGEDATFTLAVTNNGLSTADNVIVTDPLPSGMTIALPFTATGWDCSLSTTVLVDCRRATLDPGPPVSITVIATVGSGVAPSPPALTNVATVTTSTPEEVTGNNTDDAIVNVQTDADLGITKTHPITPGPVLAGTQVEFEMVVTNAGPSDASADVTVTDTLPAGFSYLSVRGPWTCAPRLANRQVIVCTKLGGGLVAGATAESLFMLTQIDPTMDAGTYRNTAVVDSPTPDTVSGNDTATDDVNIGNQADLKIVKSHDDDLVRIGENLVFTLAVSNAGPSEARGVFVTDTLPAGLTLVSVVGADDPSTWDCSATTGQQVDCTLTGPLAADTDAEKILVTALVEPEVFPTISNTAVVSSTTPEPDPDPNPNTSTDVVNVPRLVDLFITKTHAEPVKVGQPIVYTLTVGNNGPIDDDAVVTVTDPIPFGLRVTDATSDIADCSITGGVVTCTKDDGLALDETFEITVTADVLPGAYPSVTNKATVSSPTDDKDLTNNTASDPAVVPPLVDLAITKTHAGAVQVGGQMTYTVTVRNNGPTPDPGPVRMLDTLPGSLTPVSATADGMACDITGQTVTCQALAPLAVNAQLMITIVVDVGPGAFPSVSNTAIVTTPGCSIGPAATADTACPDTDLRNNTATDVAPVAPLILLQLTKTLASQEGLNATWNFGVRNVGKNATIQPIVLTDALPAGLVYVSAQGDGWACTNAANVVTCTYPAVVAAGATASPLQIVTLVTASAGSQVVNVATVNGGGPEVPSVTDNAQVTAPPGGTLPKTGGGGGRVLIQTAPLLVFLGLVLTMMSHGRRRRVAVARPMRS